MLVDEGGPDELLAHEAHAIARELAMLLGKIGITEVHVNLRARDRCHVGSSRRRSIGSRAFGNHALDDARVHGAVGGVDRNLLTVLDRCGRLLRAACRTDDAGDAHLAADDGGMAGHTTGIGDDGERLLHGRHPVGSGHRGDENLAVLELVDEGGIGDDVCLTGNLPGRGRQTGDDDVKVLGSGGICLAGDLAVGLLARPDRLGTRLKQPNLAVALVDAPLHVHVAAVVLLELFGVICELLDLLVSDDLLLALVGGNLDFLDIALGLADHLDVLVRDDATRNLTRRLVNDEVIGGDGTLHDHLTQAVGTLDGDDLVIAVGDIEREHDACGLGEDHHLDGCGKRDGQVIEARLLAIVGGAIGEGGGVALLDLLHDHIRTMHVEIGILLAGKAGIGKVFCGGRGAHGDERVIHVHLVTELGIGVLDGLDDVCRHLLGNNHGTDIVGHLAQQRRILDVSKLLELFADLLVEAGPLHELTICVCRGGKAIGYGDIGLRSHLAQRGGLSAYDLDVLAAKLVKPENICLITIHLAYPFFHVGEDAVHYAM